MRKSCKILLVGCGELGSRHLQAVASLGCVKEVHIVDQREESFALGKTRLSETRNLNPSIKFFWHRELDASVIGGDLCIVATQAKGRCALVKQIAQQLGYRNFLIEKIVALSVEEYQDLIAFCEKENISVWVNCKSRAYGIHQYIKSKLDPYEPIFFSDVGGNHGLANNGVHAADLFAFYDDALQIKSVGSCIDPVIHPSKRGKDVFDLSGTLYGNTDKGSDFVLSFAGNHNSADQISIVSKSGRFIIDHFQKFAYESYAYDNWQWKNISIDENWAVSHMTKAFARDILMKGSCELPTLAECFPAHEFILNQLQPHFNKLMNVNNNYCPVT